jgi:hypothetical protein
MNPDGNVSDDDKEACDICFLTVFLLESIISLKTFSKLKVSNYLNRSSVALEETLVRTVLKAKPHAPRSGTGLPKNQIDVIISNRWKIG